MANCERVEDCEVCDFYTWQYPREAEDHIIAYCTLFRKACVDVKRGAK